MFLQRFLRAFKRATTIFHERYCALREFHMWSYIFIGVSVLKKINGLGVNFFNTLRSNRCI